MMKFEKGEKRKISTFQLSEENREKLFLLAQKGNVNFNKLLNEGLSFILTFPAGFMDQIREVSEKMSIHPALFVSNLLQVWAATDHALVKHCGKTETYRRAFRPRNNGPGFVTGEEVFNLTFDEVYKILSEMTARSDRENSKSISGEKAGLMSQVSFFPESAPAPVTYSSKPEGGDADN